MLLYIVLSFVLEWIVSLFLVLVFDLVSLFEPCEPCTVSIAIRFFISPTLHADVSNVESCDGWKVFVCPVPTYSTLLTSSRPPWGEACPRLSSV